MGSSYYGLFILFSLALSISGHFETVKISYNNGFDNVYNLNRIVLCKYNGKWSKEDIRSCCWWALTGKGLREIEGKHLTIIWIDKVKADWKKI